MWDGQRPRLECDPTDAVDRVRDRNRLGAAAGRNTHAAPQGLLDAEVERNAVAQIHDLVRLGRVALAEAGGSMELRQRSRHRGEAQSSSTFETSRWTWRATSKSTTGSSPRGAKLAC